MYDPQSIPPDTLTWALGQALNELNAYLCEGDPQKGLGEGWPVTFRETAAQCRSIAAAATLDAERNAWLEIAEDYENAAHPPV